VRFEEVKAGIEPGMVRDSEKLQASRPDKSQICWRLVAFSVFTIALAIAFRQSLVAMVRLSTTDETYSHMPLIPLVSAYLLFAARKRIAQTAESAFLPGLLVIGLGAMLSFADSYHSGTAVFKDSLSLSSLASLMIWLGGFIALFGFKSAVQYVYYN